MIPKDLRKAIAGEMTVEMHEVPADFAEIVKEFEEQVGKLGAAMQGPPKYAFDKAFAEMVVTSVLQGSQTLMIEKAQEHPPLMFIYTGHEKDGKLVAMILPQGLGVMDPNDKRTMVRAITNGLSQVKGDGLFVALVDEAWSMHYQGENPEANPEFMRYVKQAQRDGIASIPAEHRQEVLMINMIAKGVQYISMNKIHRDVNGKVVRIERGEVMATSEADVATGTMAAWHGGKKDIN